MDERFPAHRQEEQLLASWRWAVIEAEFTLRDRVPTPLNPPAGREQFSGRPRSIRFPGPGSEELHDPLEQHDTHLEIDSGANWTWIKARRVIDGSPDHHPTDPSEP